MANIFDNFFQQIAQGDTVKDWDHASKMFVASNYALAPKNTFLYHVFFDLNPRANRLNNMENTVKQTELGMLVKQVSLPKFSIDTKTLNAYNRPHVVQTKLHYDPVNIVFHDDGSNVSRNFWFDYYSYYYRNSDYGGSRDLSTLTSSHNEITAARQQADWGYTIRGSTSGTNIKEPYLNAIRIYSLYNKQFTEYVLVNPIIKSFQHGEHNSSGVSDTMQNQMTVEYESVMYAYGRVVGSNVMGFGDLHYDKSPSPLSAAGGGTQSILGPGGFLDSATEITTDLSNGNLGAALFKGARVTNGMKGANLGAIALPEALSLLKSGMTGNNPFGQVSAPNAANFFGITSTTTNGVNNLRTGVGSGSGQGIGLTSSAGGLAGLSSIISSTASSIGNFATDIYSDVSNALSPMPSNLTSTDTTTSSDDTRLGTASDTNDYSGMV